MKDLQDWQRNMNKEFYLSQINHLHIVNNRHQIDILPVMVTPRGFSMSSILPLIFLSLPGTTIATAFVPSNCK